MIKKTSMGNSIITNKLNENARVTFTHWDSPKMRSFSLRIIHKTIEKYTKIDRKFSGKENNDY